MAWWHMSVIPAARWLKQEDRRLKPSLGSLARPRFKINFKKGCRCSSVIECILVRTRLSTAPKKEMRFHILSAIYMALKEQERREVHTERKAIYRCLSSTSCVSLRRLVEGT